MSDPTVIVQIINLDRSADRMAQMASALDQQNVSYVRLPGVDGKSGPPEVIANYDAQRSKRLFGRPLLAGEVGCYQSHLNAAQAFDVVAAHSKGKDGKPTCNPGESSTAGF